MTTVPVAPDRGTLSAAKRALMEQRLRGFAAADPGIPAGARPEGPAPLSPAQHGLWVIDQLLDDKSVYTINRLLRLRGPLNHDALRGALDDLVKRHEILRTRYALHDTPVQVVAPAAGAAFDIVDLTGRAPKERFEAALALSKERRAVPFDLGSGPVFRAQLIAMGPEDHLLQLSMHHICSDYWTCSLLSRELGELYTGRVTGRAPALSPARVQYADFARWQAARLSGPLGEQQLAYWRSELSGLPPVLALPTDRERPREPSHRGGSLVHTLPPALAARLRELSDTYRVRESSTLLAAFAVLLHRHSGQARFAIGSLVSGRTHADVESVLGLFANTVAITADFTDTPLFTDVLRQTHARMLGALDHQDVTFEQVVTDLRIARDPSVNPVFQVLFQHFEGGEEQWRLPGVEVTEVPTDESSAKVDLTLHTVRRGDTLHLELSYSTDLFDADRVRSLCERLEFLLEQVVERPSAPVGELRLMRDGELAQVVAAAASPHQEPLGELCVPQLFEQQVRRTPDAVAVSDPHGSYSYSRLNRQANRLARALRERGIGPEQFVGVCLPHSRDLLVGLLGVLKAGAAFVPLDPAHPVERLRHTVEDARPAALVTHPSTASMVEGLGLPLVSLDELTDDGNRDGDHDGDLPPTATGDQLAYAAFTSGSTGRPKGIQIEHRSLVNQLRAFARITGFGPSDVMAGLATVSFDPAFVELFLPVVTGGRVAMVPRDAATDGYHLDVWLRSNGATVVQATPSSWRLLLAAGWKGSAGLRVLCGGEALSPQLACDLLERADEVWNVYGPTETTVWACAQRVRPGGGSVPLGRAIDHMRVQVLDSALRPVPPGVAGEICIGGIGLGRGYLQRPGMTALCFVPDPMGEPGSRLYRTGDAGRLREDGSLEYLGRTDHQIKIRGHRIEPGEIEARLLRAAEVGQAAVVVKETAGSPRLIGYVAPAADRAPDIDTLRADLRRALPDYMVPAVIVALERMPMTASGKIDRKALPEPTGLRTTAEQPYAPPRTVQERTLAEIWAQVLGVDRVGVHDNFFDHGGDSMMSIHIVARARAAGLAMLPRHLFSHQTVAELAAELAALPDARSGEAPPADQADVGLGLLTGIPGIEPTDFEAVHPASSLQAGMLFHTLADDGGAAGEYVQQFAFDIEGPLDAEAFVQAWRLQTERHPALRTQFLWEDQSQPLALVRRSYTAPFTRTDLRGAPATAVEQWVREQAARPFDLAAEPPLRFALARTGVNSHRFVWQAHHILIDGWSLQIVLGDVFAAYQALRAAPDKDVSLALAAPVAVRPPTADDDSAAYWQDVLNGFTSATPLPAGRGESGSSSTGSVRLVLSDEDTAQLREFARKRRVTVSSIAQGAWALLLGRHSGERDVVVGVTVAGRSAPVTGIDRAVGMLINTLPVRMRTDPHQPLGSWLDDIHRRNVELRDHEADSLAQIQRASSVPAGLPLFESIVVFENFKRTSVPVPDDLRLTDRTRVSRTGYPLVLDINLHERMVLKLNHRADRYDLATAERLLGQYARLLVNIARADAAQPLSLVQLTSSSERERLTGAANSNDMPFPDACLHELFEEWAARTPHAPAIVTAEGAAISYGELDRRANRLAHALRARGAGPEVLVGVCLEHSVEMFVALLGILKSGAAYVPLDPEHPAERLGYILEDTRTGIVVTEERLLGALPTGFGGQNLCLDRDAAMLAGQPESAPRSGVSPQNLVYVLYTSGSTGRPKGVLIPHQGLVNYLWWAIEGYGTQGAKGAPMLGSIAFDLSVPNFFLPFISGKDVTLLPKDPSLSSLAELLCAPGDFSLLKITPGHLDVLRALVDDGSVRSVRTFVVGADEVRPETVTRWQQAAPDARIINEYGPTETVVGCSVQLINHSFDPSEPVPIGVPIGNLRMYVLDEFLNPLPPGIAGELYIGGVGVGRGYLGKAALTGERFLPDPFAGAGRRMYATGDLARLREDGSFSFLGRTDHQVKIRGYRVELGEVEAQLLAHPAVTEAVVVARADHGVKRLVGYAVPVAGAPVPEPAALRSFLATSLPEYMVPAVVVVLDAMPLSQGGKVDRSALPAPSAGAGDAVSGEEAPANRTERALAKIWEEVLRCGPVSATDDFFALGGDSMLSLQVMARARREGLPVTPRQIFAHTTVRALAAAVADAGHAPVVLAQQGAVSGQTPLTPIQHWFTSLDIRHDHYNRALLLESRTAVDASALEQALRALVEHHDALRLRLVRRAEGWTQHTAEAEQRPLLSIDDLSQIAPADQERRMAESAEAAQRCLDLADGPLLHTVLFRRGQHAPDRLLVVMHHLAVDTASMPILLADLNNAYGRAASGEPPRLPAKSTAFRQWSQRLNEHAKSSAFAAELPYWTAPGAEPTIPVDDRDVVPLEGDVRSIRGSLDARATDRLTRRARERGFTVHETLVTALALTLGRWTGSDTAWFDMEGHGREPLFDDIDVSRTVGWFTALRPVRLTVADGAGAAENLAAVADQLATEPHHGIGHGLAGLLVGQDAAQQTREARPHAPISFNYHGRVGDTPSPADAPFVLLPFSLGTTRDPAGRRPYLLEIEIGVLDGVLHIEWRYSPGAHRQETVERLSLAFLARLEQLSADLAASRRPSWSVRARQALGAAFDRYQPPGVSAALLDGGICSELWTRGVLAKGTGEPVTARTVFQAGSASKHVTALGVLRLVDDRVLDLDAPIADLLTSWRLPGSVAGPALTLRHLLSHTAGLSETGYEGRPAGQPVPSLSDVLHGRTPATTAPVRAELAPGGRYRYSGSHYTVIQQICEDVSGEAFAPLMRRLVLDPLEMRDSAFAPAPPSAGAAAHAHLADGCPDPARWRAFGELAAAGLWTTAADLARVEAEILRSCRGESAALLSPRTAEEMLTAHSNSGYGLGAFVTTTAADTWFGHAGNTPGFRCFIATGREHGHGLVLMVNGDAGGDFIGDVLAELGIAGSGEA